MASFADMPSYAWRSPSPPPPWADAKEEDDKKLNDVKHLLALKHTQMLDFWSKYRANRRYSEELETIVKELKHDITLNDRILEAEGHYIEELQDTIVALKRELNDTNDQSNMTNNFQSCSTPIHEYPSRSSTLDAGKV